MTTSDLPTTVALYVFAGLCLSCGGGGEPLTSDFCHQPGYGETRFFADLEQYNAWLAAGNNECRFVAVESV